MQKSDLGRLLDYTTWANRRIVRAAATLTLDEYKRDLGSSHGGVRGTLTHILGAEWLWLERVKGVSPPGLPDESEFPNVMALHEKWKAVDQHRRAWFDALKEKGVQATVRYKSLKGEPFEQPLWQIIQHMTNHSTYHRGQVTTMFRLLGAKPVVTDMVIWDRRPKRERDRES